MRWADQVAFIGVAWSGDDESFQAFVDRHGLTFPTISDDGGDVFDRFEVPGQPAFVVIDTDGTVQQFFGALDEAEIDAILTDVTAA